jgi:hypothetical protein
MAVTETRQLPPQFIADLGTDLGTQLIAQSGRPTVAPGIAGLSQLAGESAADFAKRQQAAQEFDVRKQSIAGLAPQVADQTKLQKDAQALATQAAGTTGLASFQPFLDRAKGEAQIAAGLGTQAFGQLGTAGATLGGVPLGAQAFQQDVQQFMSPYQSQVIDASLQEFDRNKAIQEQSIRDQQAALGALGSGRAGVQLAEFGTGAARERALLQANLLQQGFQQEGILGTNIGRLGSLGAINQAQAQAEADALREANRQAAMLPQENLARYGAQVTGLMGGYPGTTTQTFTPNPTPLQTALGIGTTLAGLYLGNR